MLIYLKVQKLIIEIKPANGGLIRRKISLAGRDEN